MNQRQENSFLIKAISAVVLLTFCFAAAVFQSVVILVVGLVAFLYILYHYVKRTPQEIVEDTTQNESTIDDKAQDSPESKQVASSDMKEPVTTPRVKEAPYSNAIASNETSIQKPITQDYSTLEPYDPKLDLSNYHYPTIDLLDHYQEEDVDVAEERSELNDQIIRAFLKFGVKISSIRTTIGPVVSLCEITPAAGVPVSRIRNLEDDLALELSAPGVRFVGVIPGRGYVGLEIPNEHRQIVSIESILNTRKFQESTYELPLALGKTISNEIFMVDLAKLPHLLISGATGQGKSIGLHTIISSLLYKKHPAEFKLVLIDTKRVELVAYEPIANHFLAQIEGSRYNGSAVLTDTNEIIRTFNSLCVEMDDRYLLLKDAGVRTIKEYNEKFKARMLNPSKGHRFLPYIVVVIDEYGDLMMTAGKVIEFPICRLAQLARAVGIHLVIATQRPTVNIITGNIKANFPARMAFKVSQWVDSQTIIDRPGANRLVGKGDMLFLAGVDPVRVQCPFVSTQEVERIAHYISQQPGYNRPYPLPDVCSSYDDGEGPDEDIAGLDPMFEDVARLVVQMQLGSTSFIQRKFAIGYNRAGRLMDQLEIAGIVGPAQGSRPREVLCMSEEELQFRLDNMKKA